MHEIGVLYQAIKTVNHVAEENQIDRVKCVTLEVGELTGYLPVFFETYFPVVAEDFPIVKGASIRINIVRGEAICGECETLYNVMRCEGACPKCKSREKKIIGGMEFLIREIEY